MGAQKEKKLWFKANPATEGTPDQKRIFWFRAKEYGWGWYPATWEGWLVLLVFIALWIFAAVRVWRFVRSITPDCAHGKARHMGLLVYDGVVIRATDFSPLSLPTCPFWHFDRR